MMNRLRNRVALVLVLLSATALVSATLLYPPKMERTHLKARELPLELGRWIGREVVVEEYVYQILETRDVVERSYADPTRAKPVHLAVVYSPDNRRVAHPPELCYTGSGWEVNDKRIVQVEGLPPMVRLVISHGLQKDLVFYCYKSGPDFIASYYEQQFNIVRNYIARRSTASALVRFSIDADKDEAAAEKRLLDFARLMMPEIKKTLTD
ncbi:MAG: exosortase C-terminal domain/associated protein EpsI [Candidatus Sumerlaeia bacterium]